MVVRVKSTPNSPRQSVQIVESVREPGARWPRQRIVRHVGMARNDEELVTLKRLAEQVQSELLHHQQRSIPGMEPPTAPRAIEGESTAEPAPIPVDLRPLREQERRITGIPEVYGRRYPLLGFDRRLPRSRYRASNRA